MIFSSYEFLFVFLPVVIIIYFLLHKLKYHTAAKYFLALASLYFYWRGSPSFLPYFILSIFFNYFIGLLLNKFHGANSRIRRKMILIAGIIVNVIFLGYFKYMNFMVFNVNFLFKTAYELPNIILPIGISFFTFQLIAYLVDSYRGETGEYKFLNYLLFITFFPQLIVGPIVHHKEVVPQYNNTKNYSVDFRNLSLGLFLFALGCTKKLLIADKLTAFAGTASNHPQELSMIECWLMSVGYTVSYYFDLSGYADMAIGLGHMFNVTISINFNSPYKARNFADYWRRWHITLSRFLGDYIFRSVFKKGDGSAKFYFAIFITFLVSGIWHGAGWTFVIWGVINAVFVMSSHAMTRANKKLPFFLAWSLTFAGVILTRIFFVSRTFSDAFYVIRTLFNVKKFYFFNDIITNRYTILVLIIGLAIAFFFPNTSQIKEKFKPTIGYSIITVILIFISILTMNEVRDFLYFQF